MGEIETGCKATVSMIRLPFACRHQDEFDAESLRDAVKEILSAEYDTDDITDIDLLHILCTELKVDGIRGDQWHFVEAQRYGGNKYLLECDNIVDGLCAIFLRAHEDETKEDQ